MKHAPNGQNTPLSKKHAPLGLGWIWWFSMNPFDGCILEYVGHLCNPLAYNSGTWGIACPHRRCSRYLWWIFASRVLGWDEGCWVMGLLCLITYEFAQGIIKIHTISSSSHQTVTSFFPSPGTRSPHHISPRLSLSDSKIADMAHIKLLSITRTCSNLLCATRRDNRAGFPM